MKKSYFAISMAALAVASVAAAEFHFDFHPFTSRTTGSWAESVAVGDINADGLNDVVLATGFYFDEENDYSIMVYRQLPDGSLGLPQKLKYALSGNDAEPAIADINNDGINDILVGRSSGFTSFLAALDGKFRRTDFGIEDCLGILALDVNADGNIDVACGSSTNAADIHYGNGAGGFGNPVAIGAGHPGGRRLKMADLTGDGRPDLVTAGPSPGIYAYPQQGTGFGAPAIYPAPPTIWPKEDHEVGDFNGDGRNDIAVAIGGNRPESSIWLYYQQANGSMAAPVRMPSYDIPVGLTAYDLDGNGLQDLLVSHNGWAAIGRFMQESGRGLHPEILSAAPSNGWSNPMAVGDFNDDGCADVALADYNAGLATLLGYSCPLPVRRAHRNDDFNGDGRSDLFWRNLTTGANALWRSASHATPQVVTGVANPDWDVVATGDFNGDRRADLLWRNPTNGTTAIWRSANDATPQPVARIIDLDWNIEGVGDFDGDGRHDLLWRNAADGRNAIWYSANVDRSRGLATLPLTGWSLAGIGDFDADGRDDILWHNTATRANMVWPSGNPARQRHLIKVTNPAWVIAGVGDFDGDKHSDILWRDAVSGTNAIWKRSYYGAQQAMSPLAGSAWTVQATGDYDGDGKDDVLWRNSATGENIAWSTANARKPLDITDVTNLQWRIQP